MSGAILRRSLLAAAFALALSPGQALAGTKLKLASLAPQDSAWGRLIDELSAEVQKATGGQVEFKTYLGGKLGDESKVSKKLGRGLDGAFFTGQGVGLLYPAFRVMELPFLIEGYADADKVRAAIWPDLVAGFEKHTEHVLVGPGETGMVYLFGKTPITDVAGLRAAKLWVWEGDKVASDTFKVFGVSPRPLDILTVVQQLKSGGIDTVYNSPAGAVALGWTGDLRNVSGKAFAYASGGFVLTKQAWAQIPEAQREVVRGIVARYGEKIIQQARKDNDAALARLTAAGGGLTLVPIQDAKYAEFKKVGVAAWPTLAGNLNAQPLLEKARKALGK
jgi:TRAP-type C4-dicarboxylate transport system substrate-binding protein